MNSVLESKKMVGVSSFPVYYRIRLMRLISAISQRDLALRSGIRFETLARYEAGKQTLSKKTLDHLIAALFDE